MTSKLNNVMEKKNRSKISKIPGVSKEPGFIKWNFTKFVVSREGKVVYRFGPTDKPEEMEEKVKELL